MGRLWEYADVNVFIFTEGGSVTFKASASEPTGFTSHSSTTIPILLLRLRQPPLLSMASNSRSIQWNFHRRGTIPWLILMYMEPNDISVTATDIIVNTHSADPSVTPTESKGVTFLNAFGAQLRHLSETSEVCRTIQQREWDFIKVTDQRFYVHETLKVADDFDGDGVFSPLHHLKTNFYEKTPYYDVDDVDRDGYANDVGLPIQ